MRSTGESLTAIGLSRSEPSSATNVQPPAQPQCVPVQPAPDKGVARSPSGRSPCLLGFAVLRGIVNRV